MKSIEGNLVVGDARFCVIAARFNDAIVARMLEGDGNMGFDAGRNEYVDLVEEGIVDPTKVVRIALENAVSVASVLLLTEATMTEIPEEEKQLAPEPAMSM